MGRKKIYETEQERHDAEKRRKRDWYYRNQTETNKRRMRKYYQNKKMDSQLS